MDKSDEPDGDKPFEPTQSKLEKARREGDLARSNDIIAAGSYAGFLLAFLFALTGSLSDLASYLAWFIEQPDRIAPLLFEGSYASGLPGMTTHLVALLSPWFLLPAGMALLVILARRHFVITPAHAKPKLSRISPIAVAKQKFGATGLFEFAKGFVKLLIFAVVLWFFMETQIDDITATLWTEPRVTLGFLGKLITAFLITVLVIAVLIGLLDMLWQQHEYMSRNRMSYKDMQDETKESEGDPYQKQQRRQRGMELAANKMLLDVPKADVVIVNPTHYAVALRWSRKKGEAPVCVAKGVDAVAAQIRAIAAENGVPLHSDPPAARALHATTKIGAQISPDHYKAAAAAIRFAETLKRKARQR
jgi:flagellar biosynthetic protein FlhB